jgi:hypothetical protein
MVRALAAAEPLSSGAFLGRCIGADHEGAQVFARARFAVPAEWVSLPLEGGEQRRY